jgi:hypothetical protein
MKYVSFAFIAALAFSTIGCKKKGAPANDCAAAINHSMDLSKAELQKMGADDKAIQQMVDLGIQHCKDDKWSADAIKCMVDAKTMDDAQGCYGKLSTDQQNKMNSAVQANATAGSGGAEAGSGSAAMGSGSAEAGSGSAEAGSGSAAMGSGGSAEAAGSGSAAAGSAGSAATK